MNVNCSVDCSIGTKPGLSDVVDPNADLITGNRKTPDAGNAGTNTSISLLLDQGTYYWSVQAIDAANAVALAAPHA